MSEHDHYVIIGNGPAGNKAADVLRDHDGEAKITIISDEWFSFYYRHLLCDFIEDKREEDELVVRPYQLYKEKKIRMRLGQRVERVDPETKTLYLKHMEKVHYTKLIIAVGGKPYIPPTLARFEPFLTVMSTYTDAVRLKPKLAHVGDIVVLGGDFTSIRFIKMLVELRKKVTVFLRKESFWPFELTDEIAAAVSRGLGEKGVATVTEMEIKNISSDNSELIVDSSSGERFYAGMVFCFMGLRPNIEFLVGSGINTEQGVLVNERLQTNYEDIFACGDCAQIYNPELKNYWVSIGWGNAEIQGQTAALNLLGNRQGVTPYEENILQVEGLQINTPWWKNF